MFTSSFITAPFVDTLNHLNSVSDWMFYDIANLSSEERQVLLHKESIEGSIISVYPSRTSTPMGIASYRNFQHWKHQSHSKKHLTIAGVGSSDIGAVSFARTFANRYQEPVDAIIAGYGIKDLPMEALGGWFILGNGKQYQHKNQAHLLSSALSHNHLREPIDDSNWPSNDTLTLLRILLDEDIDIVSMAGHSKGALSLVGALNIFLQKASRFQHQTRKSMSLTTFGTVVNFPTIFPFTQQFIGSLDTFGWINSAQSNNYQVINGAWHHLNTQIPWHLDVQRALDF